MNSIAVKDALAIAWRKLTLDLKESLKEPEV